MHEAGHLVARAEAWLFVDGEILLGSVSAVDALGPVGDRLRELRRRPLVGDGNAFQLNLDAHLIVLVVRLGATVFLVGTATVAAAVIHDGDHRRHAAIRRPDKGIRHLEAGVRCGVRISGTKQRRSNGSGGARLDHAAPTRVHRHDGREGCRGACTRKASERR